MGTQRISSASGHGISVYHIGRGGKTAEDLQIEAAINALIAELSAGKWQAPTPVHPPTHTTDTRNDGGGNQQGNRRGGQSGGIQQVQQPQQVQQQPQVKQATLPPSAIPSSSPPSGAALNIVGQSSPPGTVVAAPGSAYNYTPTAIQNSDGSRDIYWGAGQPGRPGDSIYTAHAPPGGQFGAPTVAFNSDALSNGVANGGKMYDTCDPSVVEANGKRYLYTGIAGVNGDNTSIAGAVQGPDGTFTQMKLGSLVSQSANAHTNNPNNYGRGQPSVIQDGKYFYMSATDTNGRDGEGSYLFRSSGAGFADGQTETLTSRGWEPLTTANNTEHALHHNDALDLAIDPATGDKIAIGNGGPISELNSWNNDFTQTTRPALVIPNQNVDESGFLRSAGGNLVGGLSNFTFYTATTINHLQDGHPAPDTIRQVNVHTA